MTSKMLFTALAAFLTLSDSVFSHGGPEISVLERAMHPREIASRQLAANKRHVQARECATQIAAFERKRKLARRRLSKRVDWDPYVTAAEIEPHETTIKNTTCITAPEVTEGPYYLNNDLVRQDVRENQGGIPFELDIGIIDTSSCQPLSDVLVEIWHANATGYYSGFGTGSSTSETPGTGDSSQSQVQPTDGMSMSPGAMPSGGPGDGGDGMGGGGGSSKNTNENFLRGGWQTNANGIVEFLSVYPGFYTGRAIHIHLMVHQNITYNQNGTYVSRTSSLVHIGQMFFDDDFSDQIMSISPYSENQNTRSYNDNDSIEAEEMANGYNALVDVELIGSSPSDGVLGFITVGVNSQAEYDVTSYNYYEGGDNVISSVWTASTSTTAGTKTGTGTITSTRSTTSSGAAEAETSASSGAGLRAGVPMPLMWLRRLVAAYWFE